MNKAISGRSSKSFRDEGNWTPIHEKLTAGDFVFIQFGHNDQKQKDPKRYTEPFGTYTENLSHYIKDIKAKGATPVLLTSINRNSWTDETTLAFSLGDYPDAVRALAKKEQIRLVDLEKVTRKLYEGFGPKDVRTLFLYFEPGEEPNYPDGKNDGTHLSKYGAGIIAQAVATELILLGPPFDTCVKLPKKND